MAGGSGPPPAADAEDAASPLKTGAGFDEMGELCLVTGANGFVGSHLVEELVRRGSRVRALVRKTSDTRWLDDTQAERAFGDVTDPASLGPALEGCGCVFHVAGVIKARDRETYLKVNAGGTAALLEACARMNRPPRRFVLVSSLAAGGPSGRGPAVVESDPPRPISFYGESKLKAEELAAKHFDRLPIVIVRPPVIYGPREVDIFEYIKTAARFGLVLAAGPFDSPLSMAHVRDVVEGLILAAKSDARGEVYYIAGPDVATGGDVGDALGAALKRKLRRLRVPLPLTRLLAAASEVQSAITRKPALLNREKVREILADGWVCNIDKARAQLGFQPRVGIREGIRETIEWYRAQGWMK